MARSDSKKGKIALFFFILIFTGLGLYQSLNTAKEVVQNAKNTTAQKIERALKGAE